MIYAAPAKFMRRGIRPDGTGDTAKAQSRLTNRGASMGLLLWRQGMPASAALRGYWGSGRINRTIHAG